MAYTNAEIIEAWQASSTNAELRTKIRAAFSEHAGVVLGADIRAAWESSPLIGEDSNQISPRASSAGFRDALPIEVLTMIMLQPATQVPEAIEEMSINTALNSIATGTCHPDPSKKSKTGQRFGWPAHIPLVVWEQCAHDLNLITGEMPMGELPLEDLCVAHSILCDEYDPEEVNHAFRESLSEAKVEGVLSMAEIDPSPDRSNESRITESEFYQSCIRVLDDGSSEDTTPTPTAKTYEIPSDEGQHQLIDLALGQAGLPKITELIGEFNAMTTEIVKLKTAPKMAMPTANAVGSESTDGSDDIPSGSVSVSKAWEVFELKGTTKRSFEFDVPVWDWDHDHPHVPAIDHNYQFQANPLMRVLYAIITNNRCYLHGHTGTGKTTLVEQVAARLRYPFMRLNFDSEITRMDLIGRDVLTQEEGTTTSSFMEGILPQMMQGPYIGCFDEIDFVRPDVSYVMQRALEGNGLMLTEDGGRMIVPHKMFRMFATGNTVGQGDEFGMYQGARPQSLALLDRFTVWSHIDYMPKHSRKKLIKANASRLNDDDLDKIDAYVQEHLTAFKEGKVLQPISPRGYIALGQAVMGFYSFFPTGEEDKAFQQAFETVILDRATVQDKVVLNGIAQRVFS
jgi:cobaltochelatase CobS